MQQWKLNHGLILNGRSIQPSKEAVFDGDLDISLYEEEPIVYININDSNTSINYLAYSDNITSELQPFDVCINFPVAEITYEGVLKSFSTYMEDDENLLEL